MAIVNYPASCHPLEHYLLLAAVHHSYHGLRRLLLKKPAVASPHEVRYQKQT